MPRAPRLPICQGNCSPSRPYPACRNRDCLQRLATHIFDLTLDEPESHSPPHASSDETKAQSPLHLAVARFKPQTSYYDPKDSFYEKKREYGFDETNSSPARLLGIPASSPSSVILHAWYRKTTLLQKEDTCHPDPENHMRLLYKARLALMNKMR